MKKTLLAFTLALTTASGAIALHLASIPNPTEAQKALSTTVNTIALSGTGAIFAMLNDSDRDEDNDKTK
jgi:multisubunit Na+/H+ antiporter MnhB subunit